MSQSGPCMWHHSDMVQTHTHWFHPDSSCQYSHLGSDSDGCCLCPHMSHCCTGPPSSHLYTTELSVTIFTTDSEYQYHHSKHTDLCV
jgi:hypothetical protein